MKFSKQNPVYIEDIEEYKSVFLHANVTLSMFGYNLKEDRVILICHKLFFSLPKSKSLGKRKFICVLMWLWRKYFNVALQYV